MDFVILTQAEIVMAKAAGKLRRSESIRQGLIPAHGCSENYGSLLKMDMEGAAAEMAYCKYRRIYFSGVVNNFKEADVGSLVQIRSTIHENGCLIVRNDDDEYHYYVLVVGEIPRFGMAGWIKGVDAKRRRFVRSPNNRPPAYFVPQKELTPFNIHAKRDMEM